jgi:hypothetical protein
VNCYIKLIQVLYNPQYTISCNLLSRFGSESCGQWDGQMYDLRFMIIFVHSVYLTVI